MVCTHCPSISYHHSPALRCWNLSQLSWGQRRGDTLRETFTTHTSIDNFKVPVCWMLMSTSEKTWRDQPKTDWVHSGPVWPLHHHAAPTYMVVYKTKWVIFCCPLTHLVLGKDQWAALKGSVAGRVLRSTTTSDFNRNQLAAAWPLSRSTLRPGLCLDSERVCLGGVGRGQCTWRPNDTLLESNRCNYNSQNAPSHILVCWQRTASSVGDYRFNSQQGQPRLQKLFPAWF